MRLLWQHRVWSLQYTAPSARRICVKRSNGSNYLDHASNCVKPWLSSPPPDAMLAKRGQVVRIAIFGCGGFGREILRLAQESSAHTDAQPVFVADDSLGPVLNHPVITPDQLEPEDELVIAIGSPANRRAVAERITHKYRSLIAHSAIVGPDVTIGEGAIICDYTILTASARIGRQFHCNIYSYVAHDCVIGDYVTFAPRVSCNGNVRVEDGAYIGTGAVIKQGTPSNPTVIGAGSVVGMGAVVTKSVAAGATVVGNPAAPFRQAIIP